MAKLTMDASLHSTPAARDPSLDTTRAARRGDASQGPAGETPARARASDRYRHVRGFRVLSEDTTAEGVGVIALAGELDYLASPQLRELLFEHIGAGRRRLVLDLSAVTFIDTTALGVLVAAVMRLRAGGERGPLAVVCPDGEGSLAVVAPEPRLRRTYQISGLDGGVGLYRSREEALAETGGPAGWGRGG